MGFNTAYSKQQTNWTALPLVTISIGGSLSAAVDIGEAQSVAAVVHWAGIPTATALAFQVSIDGTTGWRPLLDKAGAEITCNLTATSAMKIDKTILEGFRFIKVRSGSNATPVTQLAADLLLYLVTVPI